MSKMVFKNWDSAMETKKIVCYLFSIFLVSIGIAQSGNSYEKEILIKGKDTLRYRILWPIDFTEDKEYPVVLFLHGAGERDNDNQKQLVHGSRLFLDSEFREKHPSIVIFPQCPKNDYWSNISIDRTKKGREKFRFKYGEIPNSTLALVIDLMDQMVNKNFTKNDQVYIGGLSMGGMGTFEMLYRRPNMFAAAFPICGGGDPNSVSEYANKVALWIFHGARDTVVDPTFSVDMVEAILKAGGFPKFSLYDFANHNSWDTAFAEPELLYWLFSNKKKNKE